MQRIIFYLIGCALLFPNILMAAEESVLPQVSLQAVLEDVTETNPSILEALEHYKSVLAERSIATSEYYPTIGTSLSAGPERTKGVPTDDVEKNLAATTATIYARQNLFNGWKTSAFVDETDARVRAAAFEVLNVANRVYLETAEAYISVVKAKQMLKIAEENAFTQEQIMRQIREKTDAGFNRVSELYNSESRLALAKGSFISRQQDLNQAIAIFHRQFGHLLQAGQFIEPPLSYKVPGSLAETVDLAFKTHPALKVAQYNIQTLQYTKEKSSAAYWPSLDLELQGQYRDDTGGEEGGTTQTGAFLTLNYTFFDGGLRSGSKARDLQALSKERQRAYIERRNANETVRLAWNIMEAEDAKRAYLDEHVSLSAKTLEAFKEEYYAGRRTLLDLLNMENEHTDAKLSKTDSQFSYLVSLYRIMQATGVLLDEHDTGLRSALNLPADNMEDMEGYEDVEIDRDKDNHLDEVDQCDNSTPDSPSESYGCVDAYINTTGYPREEDLNLPPYIALRESNEPGNYAPTIKSPPAAAPEEAKVPEVSIRLEAKPDSDSVTDEAMEQLAKLSEALLAQPEKQVLVEGYIASDIDSEENSTLSARRANVVKEYMVGVGIDKERITVVGRGNHNPLADNSTPQGRKLNRRVEISVFKGQ